MAILLKIKNISKIYYTASKIIHALDAVTLDIYSGEIISLLGVNGAGKTTLSSILATVHPATTGDVLYQDQSIYTNVAQYRKIMSYCPQKPTLDLYLSVQDNLIFAGRYFLLPKNLIFERTQQLMQQFGLTKYASFNPDALSGGYRQRLSIARALMHNPQILILDEPTVGLDPHIRRQLWDIIKNLKQSGMTIILTTHYLDEAELLSDRVCVLSKGKIILTESVQQLMTKYDKKTLEDVFIHLTEGQDEALENMR